MATLEMTSFLFPKSAYVTGNYHSREHPYPISDMAPYLELSHRPYCPTSLQDLTAKHPRLTLIDQGHARILAHTNADLSHQRHVGDSINDLEQQQPQIWTISDIAVFGIRLNAIPGADAGYPTLRYCVSCRAQTQTRTLFFPFRDQSAPWADAPLHTLLITEYSYVPTSTHPQGRTDMWLGDLGPATQNGAACLALRKQA